MWIFNLILYFAFLAGQYSGDWNFYDQLVSQGAKCYHYRAGWGDEDPIAPPPCFYREGE